MESQKKITKLAPAKFQVATPDVLILQLDFNPIIKQFNLTGSNWQLIHWQGRPKGEREWGIYDPKTDTYRCGVFDGHLTAYGSINLLQLDDKTVTTLPSAVILFRGHLPIN